MSHFYWVGGWTGNTGFNSGYSSGSGIWTSVINGMTSDKGDYAFGPYYWGFWQNWRVGGPSNFLYPALTGGQSGSVSFPGQPGVTGWLPNGSRSNTTSDLVYFGVPFRSDGYTNPNNYLPRQIYDRRGNSRGTACLFGALTLNNRWLGASGAGMTSFIGPFFTQNFVNIGLYGREQLGLSASQGILDSVLIGGATGYSSGLSDVGYTSGPAGYGMYIKNEQGMFRINQIGFDVGDSPYEIENTSIPTGFTSDSLRRIPLVTNIQNLYLQNTIIGKYIFRNISATGGSMINLIEGVAAYSENKHFVNTKYSNIGELHLLGTTAGNVTLLNHTGLKFNIDQFIPSVGPVIPAALKTLSVNSISPWGDFTYQSNAGITGGSPGFKIGRSVKITDGVSLRPGIIRTRDDLSSIDNYDDDETVYRIEASSPSILVVGSKYYLTRKEESSPTGSGLVIPSLVDGLDILGNRVSNGVNVELGSKDGITSSYGQISIDDVSYPGIGSPERTSLKVQGSTGPGRNSNVILKLNQCDIAKLDANKGTILPSFESDQSSVIRISDGYLKNDAWLSTIYPFDDTYQGFQIGMSADASGNASDGIRVDSFDVRVNFARGTDVKINTTQVGIT